MEVKANIRKKKSKNPPSLAGADSRLAERKKAESRLIIQSRIADIFLTVPDDEMYNEVLKVILEVMQSQYGVFGYIDDDGALVVPSMTGHIWDKCQVSEKTFIFPRDTWGDSSWPRAIREKKPNCTNEPSTKTPEGHIDLRRHISFPILFRGVAIGLFQVANKETDYKEADIRLLETIARYVAPILSGRLRRERLEKELKQGYDRFQLVCRGTHDVVWDWNLQTNAVWWNENFQTLFGYTAEEIEPGIESWANRIHPEDRDRVVTGIHAAINVGQVSWSDQYRFRRKDGSYVEIYGRRYVLREASGNAVRMISAMQDITSLKKAEEEIMRLNKDLESRVVQLSALNRELERSNRDLEQFAYVASHDLQEPLRMISSFTQLLEQRYKGKLDKSADEFTKFAVEGANRMQRMINDLLSYSRLSSRGQPFEPVNSEEILAQVHANLLPLIEENQALLTHESLPEITADASQMLHLFQNLIGNAIKFRGKEPPRVHVFSKSREEEWMFGVRDNGIGIAKEYFDRIFVIFQRLHSREEYSGTGIGLAICKKIVERHGGRIWVESEPDKGSTFFFTIPKRRE